jgi:carbon monoxide dehydrogenase subunit G
LRHETSISVNATPERAWEVMKDVERWPEWTPSMSKVELLQPGEVQVSAKVRITQPKFPSAVWTVTKVEPNRYLEWRSTSPILTSTGEHRIEPEGDGCRLTLAIEQTGLLVPVLKLFYEKTILAYLDLEAKGFKARAESGVPSP